MKCQVGNYYVPGLIFDEEHDEHGPESIGNVFEILAYQTDTWCFKFGIKEAKMSNYLDGNRFYFPKLPQGWSFVKIEGDLGGA